MERLRLTYLKEWLNDPARKPLIIRGARQVGKTWLVRELAQTSGKELIELNFERNPQDVELFSSNDPQKIILNLSAAFNRNIHPNQCILFLDEIQAAPALLSKLRWFAEDFSQLPVVAAGSLLEFTLTDHHFSMPVGRIQYMHLEPMTFEEFLIANQYTVLLKFLKEFQLSSPINIPSTIHEQLINLFKEYLIIGGMPSAISNWVKEKSLKKVNQIHHDLLATYRDDFAKYSGRLELSTLETTLKAIPRMLGHKFVYSQVSKDLDGRDIKKAINLLNNARVSHRVNASSANSVPLGAEIKEKYFKEIFLDVGLISAMLGVSLSQLNSVQEVVLNNYGMLAEQVVGQLLRTIYEPYIEPTLYYWLREEKGSSAEVDYVMELGNKIFPIEVKAGSTGSLKSLHLLMRIKKLPVGIRINSDTPSNLKVETKDPTGKEVSYQLLSLPFYLISELPRLLMSLDSI